MPNSVTCEILPQLVTTYHTQVTAQLTEQSDQQSYEMSHPQEADAVEWSKSGENPTTVVYTRNNPPSASAPTTHPKKDHATSVSP